MQYDVYPNPSPRMQQIYPWVLDVQSDILSSLPTRMVVPLAITHLAPSAVPQRLCPSVQVAGHKTVLVPFQAAPLDKRLLKKRVCSLRDKADIIIAALDAVVSGV